MADSNITVSDLTLTPGFGQTFAKWTVNDPNFNGLPYLKYAAGELWSATANNRADGSFAKVAEGLLDTIHIVSDGMARWYWVKPRNVAGGYGDFYPSGATSGVAAAATASIGTNGYLMLPNGVIMQWGHIEITGPDQVVSFNTEYPNQCFNVVLTLDSGPLYDSGSSQVTLSLHSNPETTGFHASAMRDGDELNPYTTNIFWQAIGY